MVMGSGAAQLDVVDQLSDFGHSSARKEKGRCGVQRPFPYVLIASD